MSAPALDDPIVLSILAQFPGATIVDRATAPQGVSELVQIGQPIFGALAPGLTAAGWSVFPQERRGRRLPGRVDGPQWGPLAWGQYALRRPRQDEIAYWASTCAGENVAAIMGKASGYALAVDVDVGDADQACAIEALMHQHLGQSPLTRVGQYPRFMAIYRQAPFVDGVPSIPNRSWKFVPRAGEAEGDDALEILAVGKPITVLGLHHKTGQYFKWTDRNIMRCSPADAPLVTPEQMDAFIEAVESFRAFTRARSTRDASVWAYDPNAAVARADHRFSAVQAGWTCNDDGLVVDGREAFLFALAASTVRRNEALVRAGVHDGFAAVKGLVRESFMTLAEVSGRWAKDLDAEVDGKVRRLADEAVRDGRFRRPAHVDAERGEAVYAESDTVAPSAATDPFDDILSHIRRKDRKPLDVVKALCTVPDEAKAEQRRLRSHAEREAARMRGSRATRRVIDAWLRRVWKAVQAKGSVGEAVVLKAPPGMGKSTTLIERIAHMSRTDQLGPLGKAIAIMMPSGANLAEMRGRALWAGMEDIWDVDVQAMLEAGQRTGVTVQVYRGRIAAGCMRPEAMKTVMNAGIGGGGLCRRDSTEEGEPPELCPHYAACPVIRQQQLVQHADVLLLPSAYLTCVVPAEVTARVGALVIDESHWTLLAHTADLPLEALSIERAPPEVSKADEAAGVTGEGLLLERNRVAEAVCDGAKKGIHPVEAVQRMSLRGFNAGTTPLQLVESALAVTAASWSRSRGVTPDISAHELRKLAERVTTRHMQLEWRFWWLVMDRLVALDHDAKTANARELIETGMGRCEGWDEAVERACRAAGCERRAYGDVDSRLQLVTRNDDGKIVPTVRLSWRTKPNLGSLPLLFLDASASASILKAVWPGRAIREFTVTAPENLRVVAMIDHTMSDSSIVGRGKARMEERLGTVAKASIIRDLISSVSANYAWGPVLVGATKNSREYLQNAWKSPTNVYWSHYGNLRGLNLYETCVAAVGIGRMELPVAAVDGFVAALTYDSPSQPRLIDELGDGGMRVEKATRVLRMRDGRDVAIEDTRYDTAWAETVRQQFREEELIQFAGRLRSIHRAGPPPVLFLAAQCIPTGYIIDEVCSVSDVARPMHAVRDRMADIARRTGGIYDPVLGAEVAPDLIEAPYGGYDALGLDAGGRLAEGFRPVTYVEGGVEAGTARRVAWVASTEADPAGLVEAAFERVGLPVDVVEVGPPTREPVALPDVAPDRLSLQLADLAPGATMDEVRAVLADREADLRGRVMDKRRAAAGDREPAWIMQHQLEPGRPERGSLDEQMIWHRIRGSDPVAETAAEFVTPPSDPHPTGERVRVFLPVRPTPPAPSRYGTGRAA